LEFAGPVVGVVGPGDPGGGVRGPLGGHAVGFVGWTGHLLVRSLVLGWGDEVRRGCSPPLMLCKVFKKGGLALYFDGALVLKY
jgi:hypothetical protein